jgi:hypothetical protein
MISKAPDRMDPWETPPSEPDLELIETSQRLVSLSEDTFPSTPEVENVSAQSDADARIIELETQKQYLFQRNVTLVARVAELEVLNRRLYEEMSALKKSVRAPWFVRWLGRSGTGDRGTS